MLLTSHLLRFAAVAIGLTLVLVQSLAMVRLTLARKHASYAISMDEVLRARLLKQLLESVTPEAKRTALEAFERAIHDKLEPRDAEAIDGSIGAQSDDTKIRFARRLVAREGKRATA
jgi:hypothetical protein